MYITLIEAVKECNVDLSRLVNEILSDKIDAHYNNGEILVDPREVVGAELEKDPELKKQIKKNITDVLSNPEINERYTFLKPLLKHLESYESQQKEILRGLFERIYYLMPEDIKEKLNGPSVLYYYTLNLGIIEIPHPPNNDKSSKAKHICSTDTRFITNYLITQGIRVLSRENDPNKRRVSMNEFMKIIKECCP